MRHGPSPFALMLVLMLAPLALFAPGPPAHAAIPSADKVVDATADRNREAGRERGLRLDVVLRFEGDAEPVAVGALWAHPDGRVGLELRAGAGFVERHVLRAGRVYASRDGTPVDPPRPFLPPVHLLQIGSAAALSQALRGLGVDPDQVVLGRAGDHDCYVVGGRAEGQASLWVDVQSYEPVGFDRGDGVQWRVGPLVTFGEIQLPAYLEIIHPGHRTARLEVGGAKPAPVPDLDVAWLEAPGLGDELGAKAGAKGRSANEVR